MGLIQAGKIYGNSILGKSRDRKEIAPTMPQAVQLKNPQSDRRMASYLKRLGNRLSQPKLSANLYDIFGSVEDSERSISPERSRNRGVGGQN